MAEKVEMVIVSVEKYKCPICGTLYEDRDDAEYCKERGRTKVEISDIRGHSDCYWVIGDYILNTYYRTAVKIIGEDIKAHAIRPLVLDANNNTFIADASLFNVILPKGLAPYFREDMNKIANLEASNGKS